MKVILIQFLIGRVAVCLFAVLGDLFNRKTFACLFGAAPSVALATLGFSVGSDSRYYASTEARSMMAGAVALLAYASCVSWILMRGKFNAMWTTLSTLPVWAGVAFGLWYIWLK